MSVGHLIIGCGYVGGLLARELLSAGAAVVYTARSAQRLAELQRSLGACGVAFDAGAESGPLPALDLSGMDSLDVYCLLTPSALTNPAARDRLLAWLATLPVRCAILTSSTAIYGERAGRIVTAESAIHADSEREKRLFTIEQAWLRAPRHAVVRFAGLYGPGRIIGLQAVRDGALLPGQPAALLNLLHQADAVSLLLAHMRAAQAARVEVGSDGTPLRREVYYGCLARLLAAPAPRFAAPADETACGKAVDPQSTMQRLGWRPRFADFRAGLAQALSATSAG